MAAYIVLSSYPGFLSFLWVFVQTLCAPEVWGWLSLKFQQPRTQQPPSHPPNNPPHPPTHPGQLTAVGDTRSCDVACQVSAATHMEEPAGF